MGKHWTEAETQQLVQMYAYTHIDTLCAYFGRSRYGIYSRAKIIGLKRPPEYRTLMCPWPQSVATRFKKGHKAWNKGLKLGSEFGGKETQFKKGQEAHNKLPEFLKAATKELSRLKKNIREKQNRRLKKSSL